MAERKKKDVKSLGELGVALWDETLKTYELTAHERSLLHQACRTLDLIESMRLRVERDGVMSKGSMGQPVTHPLLGELRQNRSLFATLVRTLGLPDVDESGAPELEVVPNQNRAAAQSKWGKAHG